MKNRLVWFLAPMVLAAFLCLYAQPAMAQQPTSGSDQGQQGEFNGENVDTGAAALDAGPEATELPEVEGPEATELPEVGVEAKESPIAAVGTPAPTAQDLIVDGDFDLQEIAGTDVPEAN